jgi:hypothetical protein
LFLEVVREVGPPGRGGVRRSREGKGGGGVLGKDEEEMELECWRRYYGFFESIITQYLYFTTIH